MITKIEAQIEYLIRKTLNISDSIDLSDVRYGSPPNWDSIRHVELFIALQNKFKVKFSTDEIVKLDSYQKLRKALLSKIEH